MAKTVNDFIQDEWTSYFCQKFRELRKMRKIPTNRMFAKEVGLDQTGLSHILGERRNFPKDYRLHAGKVLALQKCIIYQPDLY